MAYPIALLIITMLLSGVAGAGSLENLAYLPHYRLSFKRGSENTLGRPSWESRADSWGSRLSLDGIRAYGLPGHWSEGNWSRRLGANYDTVLLHLDMDTLMQQGIDKRHSALLAGLIRPGDVRVFLSIIGFSDDFLPLAEDDESLAGFSAMLAKLCRREGFDGIDINWEFPGRPRRAELDGLARLAEALSSALPEEIALSAAVIRGRLPDQRLFDAIDEVRIMAYDGRGRHATYEAAVADTETVIARFELDPGQVYLGIPWYGRNADPRSESYWRDTMNYRDIVRRYSPDPSKDTAGPFFFNGVETVRNKVEWARKRGLGGVFVWEPFYDINGPMSLARATLEAIQSP